MSRRAGPCLPPTPAIRPSAIATSPLNAPLPVPSTMVPPRMTMSCMGAAPDSCDIAMMHPPLRRCNGGLAAWRDQLDIGEIGPEAPYIARKQRASEHLRMGADQEVGKHPGPDA